MITVLCFGNEAIKEDMLAKEIADELEIDGIKFVKCSSVDDLLSYSGNVYIMDVAKGLKEVTLIEDIRKLESNKLISLHDFDLGFFLKLMNEIGKIKNVKIIGIPMESNKEDAKKGVMKILKKAISS